MPRRSVSPPGWSCRNLTGPCTMRYGAASMAGYQSRGKGNREALPAMASVGKAYTSIACGIMLKAQREQIPDGLETRVFTAKYLPEAFPLNDPRKADIKLGHLLS